jgi:hypothetical protein
MDVSHTTPQMDRSSLPRLQEPARSRIPYSDAEIVDHLVRLGYGASYDQLVFTTETVADFAEARLSNWYRPGNLVTSEQGLLIVARAQPQPLQRSRDIVVVSLGGARVVMGALNPPDCHIGIARYARTM